ncbi:MAG: PotD/PotF family extracellular solute-binding protein [Gemmatimonadales bacterium]
MRGERGGLSRRDFLWNTALGAGVSALGGVLSACGGRDRTPRTPGKLEDQLNIYNWSDYIAEDVIPRFESEFGVRVVYDTYESNEEMLAKLQAGASGYDIVVPTGYIIEAMTATGLLAPLDRNLLTNWSNLSPVLLGQPADPDNTFSVPYQWGTTGIAWRTDLVARAPDSWGVFQDPAFDRKMTMLDDGREVIGSFLKYRGHALNSVVPAELQQARDDAIEARPHLKAWLSAQVKEQLIAGDVWIAQAWSGDTAQARRQQPNLAFATPREGSAIWSDSLVIPRTSPHPRAAHEFINFVLRPDIATAIAEFTGYGSPNIKATPATPVPFPSTEELARLEWQRDLGRANQMWDRIWTEIRA